jgi:hypothetical protein
LASIAPVLLIAAPGRAATTNTAEDNFTRPNVSGSWGTTTNNDGSTNYAWQRSLGSSPYVSVQNHTGVLVYTGHNGHKLAGYVNVPLNPGGDILEEFAFTTVGQTVAGACLNVTGGTQWYQADVDTNQHVLELRKRLNGVMTTEASVPMVLTAGTPYWLREDVQVSGGVATVQARVWANGTTEPSVWQSSWSDHAPLANGEPGAMGDWPHAPVPGTKTLFLNWAYAATGQAQPAT